MNSSMKDADADEMMAVSPICCKYTPVHFHSDANIGSMNLSSPSNLLGSPPHICRRPILYHQHSYAGHEDNHKNVGSVPARSHDGHPLCASRQLSMPDLHDDSFSGVSSPSSSSSFLNNRTFDWTNYSTLRNRQQPLQQQLHDPTVIGTAAATSSSSGGSDDAPRQAPVEGEFYVANNHQDSATPPESNEDRVRREEEESIALAQMLMAEEAMASHRMSADFLRMNSDQFSEEDFLALQSALREEEGDYEEEADEDGEQSEEMSYEALLRLGERIGDVKTDRWTMIAQKEIEKLDTFQYDSEKLGISDNSAEVVVRDIDDSELKCLVCQFAYEKGDDLRRLPCGHCFHKDCIDQWLQTKDICAYCRQSICPGSGH